MILVDANLLIYAIDVDSLTLAAGTAGNLTSDAHLAALAIEHGCAVYSTDNDFKRFPGIEHVNPLA